MADTVDNSSERSAAIISASGTVLEQIGAFAFIFPGVGQIIGGAFAFAGGLTSLLDTAPADLGPSLADLEDDITEIGKLIQAQTGKLETYDLDKSLTLAKTDYDTLATLYAAGITNPKGSYVQHGTTPPELVSQADKFDPNASRYRDAAADISALTAEIDQVKSLTVYADCRSKLHTMIRKYLNIKMAAAEWNYAFTAADGSHPNRTAYPVTWPNWYEPPADHLTLVADYKQSLHEAIDFLEPVVDKLHHSYRTRLANAVAVSKTDAVPGRRLKAEWDRITKADLLDQMPEAAVNNLRGTPGVMGVVDFWKETLQTLWAEPHNGVAFNRIDPTTGVEKFDPARQVPTTWLTAAELTAVRERRNSEGDVLDLIHKKSNTKLASDNRPLIGPLRFIPWFDDDDPRVKNQRVLYLIVVNTLSEPLLVDSIDVQQGGLLTQPTVAEFPNIATNSTDGWTTKKHPGSADPSCWIDKAPTPGQASVGIWQVMGRANDDAAAIAIKFKPMTTPNYEHLYIGGRYPESSTSLNSPAVGLTDVGDASDFYQTYVKGANKFVSAATLDSTTLIATAYPPTQGVGAHPNDIAITIIIGDLS